MFKFVCCLNLTTVNLQHIAIFEGTAARNIVELSSATHKRLFPSYHLDETNILCVRVCVCVRALTLLITMMGLVFQLLMARVCFTNKDFTLHVVWW